MKQILLASLLFGSLTLPLAAQPAPDAPAPPDTKEERQKNTAAKLARAVAVRLGVLPRGETELRDLQDGGAEPRSSPMPWRAANSFCA